MIEGKFEKIESVSVHIRFIAKLTIAIATDGLPREI
jgi:hypothetical protein